MTDIFEDQKKTLKDCIDRLERLGLAYMLTGSMAMVNYAMMRMTNDIDIVVELEPADATSIIREFGGEYYVPEVRVADAIARRSMFNILNQSTFVKIDFVVRKEELFQKHIFSRRKKITFTDFEVWIIEKEDLILSKLNWAKNTKSEVQMRDVAGIIRNGYDKKYVAGWAEKLGMTEILNDCIKLLDENYVEGYDT